MDPHVRHVMAAGVLATMVGCSSSHDIERSEATLSDSSEAHSTENAQSAQIAGGAGGTAARTSDGAAQTGAAAGSSAIRTAMQRTGQSMEGSSEATDTTGSVQRAVSGDKLDDINYKFDVTVPAGGEELRCIYAQLPDDRGVMAVSDVESHYTPGSHHLLAYRSNLTSIPEGYENVWDCSDGLWQINMRGSYYEAQRPDEEHKLPEGIAHKFQPGEVLILQAHYVNATDKDLQANVDFTLHPTDESKITQEAGSIYFNDINILVPPRDEAKATMRCELPQDIHLALLWSHMHERGTHFIAETDDPGAQALGTLYEEDDWAEPDQRTYPTDDTAILHAQSHITFTCTFQNQGDTPFVFGQSAHDNEMCILHGMYWPRMSQAAEQCLLGMTTRE